MSPSIRQGKSVGIWQIIAVFILTVVLGDHSADAIAIIANEIRTPAAAQTGQPAALLMQPRAVSETLLSSAALSAELASQTATAAATTGGSAAASHAEATEAASSTVQASSTSALVIGSSSTSTSLPQPFDTSFGSNFTANTCPDFFEKFLGDSSFLDCYPFSLLLTTSQAFFAAEKSFFKVTQALDATCQVDASSCSKIMANYANEIKLTTNCGQDYQQGNPIVMEAYEGFSSYAVMYEAGCLKDMNGTYCFADSITGISSVVDSYLYYLPLGTKLPAGSQPSCSYCVQNIMDIYAKYATKSAQIVSKTYNAAAQQIDGKCGAGFVTPSVTASGVRQSAPVALSILLAMAIGFFIT